jgi:hypothetical protein
MESTALPFLIFVVSNEKDVGVSLLSMSIVSIVFPLTSSSSLSPALKEMFFGAATTTVPLISPFRFRPATTADLTGLTVLVFFVVVD